MFFTDRFQFFFQLEVEVVFFLNIILNLILCFWVFTYVQMSYVLIRLLSVIKIQTSHSNCSHFLYYVVPISFQFSLFGKKSFLFYLSFLSRTFTIHRTAEGRGYLFNSSLPLPPFSQTLRHQHLCPQLAAALEWDPLVSKAKFLTMKLCTLTVIQIFREGENFLYKLWPICVITISAYLIFGVCLL